MRKIIITVLALLCLLIIPITGQEQDAKVKQVVAVTADGLVFSAWIDRQVIRSGYDIVVNYNVENRSDQAIYLVRDNRSNVVFENDESIIFPEPLVPIGGHEPCDYKFTKVARGKSHQSRFEVSGDKYPKDTRYAEQIWNIQVGFGYVRNIRGIRVEESGDPAPCKALLNSRLKVLSLDGLILEISKP
jgi:hypothetical protein